MWRITFIKYEKIRTLVFKVGKDILLPDMEKLTKEKEVLKLLIETIKNQQHPTQFLIKIRD
jgi:hypothetical protein